jgi:hypothetical protein
MTNPQTNLTEIALNIVHLERMKRELDRVNDKINNNLAQIKALRVKYNLSN